MTSIHWRRCDYRIESLKITVLGLEESVQQLRKKLDKSEWYDGFWLLEELEPIYGLMFIALQNYINSSIYDRFESLDKQYLKYRIGNQIKETGRTDIELIISIANYYKHRDYPGDFKKETLKILVDFNLQFDKEGDIKDSPIFKALEMFSENWDTNLLIKAVEVWREKLWTIIE